MEIYGWGRYSRVRPWPPNRFRRLNAQFLSAREKLSLLEAVPGAMVIAAWQISLSTCAAWLI